MQITTIASIKHRWMTGCKYEFGKKSLWWIFIKLLSRFALRGHSSVCKYIEINEISWVQFMYYYSWFLLLFLELKNYSRRVLRNDNSLKSVVVETENDRCWYIFNWSNQMGWTNYSKHDHSHNHDIWNYANFTDVHNKRECFSFSIETRNS